MSPILGGLIDIFILPGGPVALITGILVGVFVGFMPGLSARSSLLIAIPFALALPPLVAAVLLVAIHASAQVSSTVPAVLFGAPTSSSEAATTLDGYPMALRGEGSRAVGAILSASAFGGVAGALVLLGFGAIAAQVISYIGSPEIATLALGGILTIALISETSLAAGIALGAAGVLISTIGIGPFSPEPRFTFGAEQLFDGVSAPALIAGALALPELLRWQEQQQALRIRSSYRGVWQGMLDPIRHFWLTMRASLIGIIVGITPGIGLSVAVWLSYGQAVRTSRPQYPFGEGAVEGIIAPEAAGGSKEGGALIPSLFLGVPGSSGMAILLAAFAIVGVGVGPNMLTRQPELPAAIAGTVAIANVVGMLICFAAAPLMLYLAALPRRYVVVLALVSATAAAYFAVPQSSTFLQLLAFAIFGVLLARAGLSRPALLIGFVIGPVLESAVIRSAMIHSWGALARPGVLVIVVAFAIIGYLLMRSPPKQGNAPRKEGIRREAVMPLLILLPCFVIAPVLAPGYGSMAALMPIAAGVIGAAATLWALIPAWRSRRNGRFRLDWRLGALLAVALMLSSVMGVWALSIILFALFLKPLAPKTETV